MSVSKKLFAKGRMGESHKVEHRLTIIMAEITFILNFALIFKLVFHQHHPEHFFMSSPPCIPLNSFMQK
jgi:hypothetical protein